MLNNRAEGIIFRGGPYEGQTLTVPRGIPDWFMPNPLNPVPKLSDINQDFPIPGPVKTVKYVRTPIVMHVGELDTCNPPGVGTVFSIDWSW